MSKNLTSKIIIGTALLGIAAAAAYTFVKKYNEQKPKALPEKGPDGEEIEPIETKFDMDAAKKAAGETATVLADQAKKAVRVIGEAGRAVGGVIRENYGEELSVAKKTATEKFADVKELATEKFAEAKEYAGEKFSQAKEFAGEKFSQAKEFVQEKVQELKKKNEGAEEDVEDLMEELNREAEEAVEAANEAVSETLEEAADKAEEKKNDDFIQNL